MNGLVRVRRAIVSVSDKRGVVELARGLHGRGVELVSTGGTARTLEEAGLPVTPVEAVTGLPEMLDGRVKTLHPKVLGGVLGRPGEPAHRDAMDAHAIVPFELVCVNLYPFEDAARDPDAPDGALVEQIDVGGPTMIRAGAKNHETVAVLTDPAQYDGLLADLAEHDGATSPELRRTLAVAAFARTAAYDSAIAARFTRPDPEPGASRLALGLERAGELRYGENPHQRAAVFRYAGARPGGLSLVDAEQLHGKALSYNNLLDASAALEGAADLKALDPDRTACVVVKHTNPCGAAVATGALGAIDGALAGDPLAAYGGILALAGGLDEAGAERLCAEGVFLEVALAEEVTPGALARLRERWKNLRVLRVGPIAGRERVATSVRTIEGGALVQERDASVPDASSWAHRAGPAPSPGRLDEARAVWVMAKRLSSNAIAIGGAADGAVALFGAGAGRVDRVAACRGAAEKAGERARGAIAASDAFFPFPDGPAALIESGVSMIVHPGGSKRDAETFALCDERGVTCLTTGVRHFRH